MAAREFEYVVRDAMDRADLSLSALARVSKIERGRWYAWFRGDSTPTRRLLAKAAPALHRSVAELMAPWGGDPGPGIVTDPGPALLEKLDRQVDAINRLVDQVQALVEAQPDHREVAATTADLLSVAITETLPGVLAAAGLPRK